MKVKGDFWLKIIRQVYIHLKWAYSVFLVTGFWTLNLESWFISKCFPKKRCNRNVSLLTRLWLQSAMWLCLYCSCSCSSWGTVIWSWERAVRCGNGLWRSNNYPFPLCYKERGRNGMLGHQSSHTTKQKTRRCQESGSVWKLQCEGGREGRKGRVWGKKETVDSSETAAEARPGHTARGFLDLLCWEESTAHSAAFHPHMSQISTGHQLSV